MENIGYKIIKKEEYAQGTYVVLGENKNKKISPYVTWHWVKEKNSYFWGHYFEYYTDALKDYHDRLSEVYNTPFKE